nr:golgin subfamily A member 6-like protein 7 [Physcomitrium patens]|eukprot:XP_024366020.1 golgin subfamily A member 6-like protein 7 [Physcomitrella patens]
MAECSQARNYERTNVSSSSRELGRPSTNMAVTLPVLVEYYQRVGLSGTGQQARELKELISAQITQLQMAVEKMGNEFSLRQVLEEKDKIIEDQKKKIGDLQRASVTDALKYSRLEHQFKETQAKWAKENKLAKILMELTKQECMELWNQYQKEKNRVAKLEARRSKLEDNFWRQLESSKTKNEQLKRRIAELEAEMITVTTQQGEVNPASTSLWELEKQVHALEEQLKERDTQIALLESQVRELGALNEDLTTLLNGEQVGEGVGEEAQEVETNLTYGNDETDQGRAEVQTLEKANDVVIL